MSDVHVDATVVCVHPFGIGCLLADRRTCGHADAPMLGLPTPLGMDHYPQVGETLTVEVLGYAGGSQLRPRVLR